MSKNTNCKACDAELNRANRSGYCRPCWNRSPEKLAKQSATMKAKWRDPEQRAIMAAAGTRNLMESGGQAKGAQIAKEKQTWKIASQHITEEARARGKRLMIERKIGHIPREVRPMYYDLTRKKKISAEEASALVLEHHQCEMEKFKRKLMRR